MLPNLEDHWHKYKLILCAIVEKQTLLSVKTVFIRVISFPFGFSQGWVCYICISRLGDVTAYRYINKLLYFWKYFCCFCLKKRVVFCLWSPVLLRIKPGLHSISSCFALMENHLKPIKFLQGALPTNTKTWKDPRIYSFFLCSLSELTTCTSCS